jgi:hypothetical protein
MSERKGWTALILPHLVSLTSFCEGLHITFKIILQVPVSRHQLLSCTSGTWVTEAVKDVGTTEPL